MRFTIICYNMKNRCREIMVLCPEAYLRIDFNKSEVYYSENQISDTLH